MLFISLNEGNICEVLLRYTQKGLALLGFFQNCNSCPIIRQCRIFFTSGRIGPDKKYFSWSIYAVYTRFLFLSYATARRNKIEAWFISPASREYFGVEPTTFLYVTNPQKIYPLVKDEVLLNLFFFHRCSYKNSC